MNVNNVFEKEYSEDEVTPFVTEYGTKLLRTLDGLEKLSESKNQTPYTQFLHALTEHVVAR